MKSKMKEVIIASSKLPKDYIFTKVGIKQDKEKKVQRKKEGLGYALRITKLIYMGTPQSDTFLRVNQSRS